MGRMRKQIITSRMSEREEVGDLTKERTGERRRTMPLGVGQVFTVGKEIKI